MNDSLKLCAPAYIILTTCICLGCGATSYDADVAASLVRLEVEARRSLESGDFEQAAELAGQVLQQDPGSVEGLVVAGFAAENADRIDDAIGFYSQIPDNSNPRSLEGRCLLAQLLFIEKGRAAAAEKCYRRVLEHDPKHGLAHQGIASLMEAEGRRWELIPHLLQAIRAGRCQIDNLVLLGWDQFPYDSPEVLQRCLQQVPDDPLPLLGLARIAVRENDSAEAERLLRTIVSSRPGQVEAQALLGKVLVDSGNDQTWLRWQAELPENANVLPETWYVRGLWAENHHDLSGAARCYAECCRRNADHPDANYHLYRMLMQLGHARLATPFLNRSQLLGQLGDEISRINARRIDGDTAARIARLLERLGRNWEAWGWWQFLASSQTSGIGQSEARGLFNQLRDAPLVRTLPESNPAFALDLNLFASPSFQPSETTDSELLRRPVKKIQFEDQAAAVGINFSYFNGRESGATGLHLHETTGGGVVVVDFDGDYWPDLYLAQGCEWSQRGKQTAHRDRLFRNLGNGRFEEATSLAGLGDRDFSQGATAGDFDDDGFSDLYVANAGVNRLYRNNGDGTYTDVSRDRMPVASYWSTSVVMADLNGDGWLDLYDVTYVDGDEVYTRLCVKHGIRRTCNPLIFPPAQDRLYLNQGDGRFQEVGEATGIPKGKGLGVIAADFHGSGRLSLFVANDMEPNLFLVDESPSRGGEPSLVDQAQLVGLAVDADGRAQACMGTAAGDANGDGLLDLFVTNYHMESNTLYLQQTGGLFTDSTRAARLREPSFPLLGFGTQFLDVDLDGNLDLVVSNGHLDDFSHEGIPFQMAPQVFYNVGSGRFVELHAQDLGKYFLEKHLGRGVAKLDWNRDGAEDFAVSHLDRPLALVTNRTANAGNFVGIFLRGTTSDRDAIGATVEIVLDDKSLVRQVTAGDGYMASNQRVMLFGVGDADRIDRMDVRWPSGLTQTIFKLPANEHMVVVEGRELPLVISK